jgi:hypothetical protein
MELGQKIICFGNSIESQSQTETGNSQVEREEAAGPRTRSCIGIPLRGNFGNCALWRDLNLFGQSRLTRYAGRLGTLSDISSLNTLEKLATESDVPACFTFDLTRIGLDHATVRNSQNSRAKG